MKQIAEERVVVGTLECDGPDALHAWFEMRLPHEIDFAAPLAGLDRLPPSDLAACEAAYAARLASGDADAAAAVVLAAILLVWESGRQFHRLGSWTDRMPQVRRLGPSPLADAALSVLSVNAGVLWQTDLPALVASLPGHRRRVEAAASDAVSLLWAAVEAPLSVMAGRLHGAEECLRDARYLVRKPGAPQVPRLCALAAAAFVKAAGGDVHDDWHALESVVGSGEPQPLPLHLRLTGLTHLLLVHAREGDGVAAGRVAGELRLLAIPEHRSFHHSYLHYALGVAALVSGEPANALAHAQLAVDLAVASGCAAGELFSTLVLGQALADQGEVGPARDLFESHLDRWRRHGLIAFEATARLELALLCEKQGDRRGAERALGHAMSCVPPGEPVPELHRPAKHFAVLQRPLPTSEQQPVAEGRLRAPFVDITTLGGFEVRVGGEVLSEATWRGRRAKSLLKLLISMGGRQVPAERLCDALWHEADGAQASQNLKVALWRLRQLARDPGQPAAAWVRTHHGEVSLDASLCRVDALDFEAAVALQGAAAVPPGERLALYRGDFLPGDDTPAIAAYRARLQRLYVSTSLSGAQAVLDGKATLEPACIFCVERAVAMQPSSEHAHEILMALHLKAGHVADAMVTYLSAEQALRGVLGVLPGKGLRSLRQAVVRQMSEIVP